MKSFLRFCLSWLLLGQTAILSATVLTGRVQDDIDVTYSFDTETGVMTLTGTGSTGDVSYEFYLPNDGPSVIEKCTKIVFGEGITRIGNGNFWGFENVKSIELPSTLREIGVSTFKLCKGLSEIVVPDNVEWVGDDAFCDCDGAVRLHIGKGLMGFGSVAFAACNSLREVVVDSANPYFESRGLNGIFRADTLFFGCCTTVLPEGLHFIGPNAFIRNESVTTVSFPSTLHKIGHNAFHEDYGLTTIHWADSIECIDSWAFAYCTNLECDTLRLPRYCRELGGLAFGYCSKLTSVVLNDSLRSIGVAPFSCTSVTYVRMGKNVEYIANTAFGYLELKEIYIPPTVKVIEPSAFRCETLERVDIDDIDAWCRIQFHSVEGNPATYGRIYLKGQPITEIDFPSDLTEVSTGAFSGFSDLVRINLPYGIGKIGEGAFYGCKSLKELHLPATVYEMWNSSISSSSVEDVYFYFPKEDMRSMGSNCCLVKYDEESTPVFARLHVPQGTISSYQKDYSFAEAIQQGLSITEFDPSDATLQAPSMPQQLYLDRGCDLSKVVQMERLSDGVFQVRTTLEDCSSFRFLQDQSENRDYLDCRDYFVSCSDASAWQPNVCGTFPLTLVDRGYYLKEGNYDLQVNLRTMSVTVAASPEDSGIDQLAAPSLRTATKVLTDGQLFILSNGRRYTATGVQLP